MTKTKEIITITSDELLSIIEERQSYKNMIDEIKKILEELDAKIKKAIEDSGSSTIIVGEHKASLSKFVRESVSAEDVKKYVSDEVFESIVKRNLVTRLTVK